MMPAFRKRFMYLESSCPVYLVQGISSSNVACVVNEASNASVNNEIHIILNNGFVYCPYCLVCAFALLKSYEQLRSLPMYTPALCASGLALACPHRLGFQAGVGFRFHPLAYMLFLGLAADCS